MSTLYSEIVLDKLGCGYAGQAFQSLVLHLSRERGRKGKNKTKQKNCHCVSCPERRYLIRLREKGVDSTVGFFRSCVEDVPGQGEVIAVLSEPTFSVARACECLAIWQFARHTDGMKFTLSWKNSPCHTLSFRRKWISLKRVPLYFPHKFR